MKRTAEDDRRLLFKGWAFEAWRTPEELAALRRWLDTGAADAALAERDAARIARAAATDPR